jgi:hypothetical protein
MMIGPTGQACPGCGGTPGVQPVPGLSPRVRAWSCSACRTDWAITVVNPRPWLDQLTATVELAAARAVVREIIALADQAPGLTDEQLRLRLRALAVRAAPRSATVPKPPIGRWLSEAPESAPGGRSAPDPAPLTPASHRPDPTPPREVPGDQPVPPPPMPNTPISQEGTPGDE